MRKIFLLFFLSIFILSSCNTTTPVPAPQILIATPDATKSTVTGIAKSSSTNQPLVTELIRLAKIYGEGNEAIYVFDDANSPGTYTNDQGQFIFHNVEPAQYAILLEDQNGNYLAIQETADKILTVDAVAGMVINVGEFTVDFTK